MALQAYLPDSYHILHQITAWARKRVAGGGSPIKIRIVKGANMDMEKIEAAIFDWPLAPFDNKLEVDANWKRMQMTLRSAHRDSCPSRRRTAPKAGEI